MRDFNLKCGTLVLVCTSNVGRGRLHRVDVAGVVERRALSLQRAVERAGGFAQARRVHRGLDFEKPVVIVVAVGVVMDGD